MQKIYIAEYCSDWENRYKQEAELVKRILKEELIAIHHIGSTAVRGMKAKPIIDIMPIVKKIETVEAFYDEFEKEGYECMGEFGIKGRRYFRKGGDKRTYQIHIFEESNQKDIMRHLAVRDYLRVHRDVAEQYGELKQNLALRYPESIRDYCAGKDFFMKKLEEKAVRWYRLIPEAEEPAAGVGTKNKKEGGNVGN